MQYFYNGKLPTFFTIGSKRQLESDTVARFDTTLQSFDVMNRNGRMYLGDNVWQAIQTEENQTLIRGNRWFGEQDHPFNTTESAPIILKL